MIQFIIRRLIQSVLVIVLVSVVVFLIMRLLPGDPLTLFIAQNELTNLSENDMNTLREEFGLNKPLIEQYFGWTGDLFRGDLGKSIFKYVSVSTLLKERLPITIHLGILALIISVFFGITAGTICAVRRGGRIDTIVTSIANFGMSVPIFWLGVLMVYIFSLYLKWLPVQGYVSPFDDFWLSTKSLIMPVFCLSVVSLAGITRQTRSSMLEIVRQDYIRTAWSKGLRERVIVFRHILKNGLIPIMTLIGLQVSHILGGAVLIETVFNIPGMGRLIVESVTNHDYPVIQGGIVLCAIAVALVNLLVDISYGWIDPRIRYG